MTDAPATRPGHAARAFGRGGYVQAAMPAFEARPQQVAMAEAVEAAIALPGHLIAEAGTGTGKSLAYLAPAVLSGRRVAVSTDTKNLQDQLVQKDLPFLLGALPRKFSFAKLKGVGNYVCLARLAEIDQLPGFGPDLDPQFLAWARTLRHADSGDVADAPVTPDRDTLARCTTGNDDCDGTDCAFYGECYAMRARQEARDADVVVLNHALLCVDLLTGGQGVGALANRQVLVLDEAHGFEEAATKAFTAEASVRRLRGLCRNSAVRKAGVDNELVNDVRARGEQLFAALLHVLRDRAVARIAPTPTVARMLVGLAGDLGRVQAALESWARRRRRLGGPQAETAAGRAERHAQRIDTFRRVLDSFTGDPDEGLVAYAVRETVRDVATVALRVAPVSVAEYLEDALWRGFPTVIATSATLGAPPLPGSKSPYGYARERLGVTEAAEVGVPAPFDYRRRALVYLPPAGSIPDPSGPAGGSVAYFDALAAQTEELLVASDGRAFCLFTSRTALEETHRRLGHRIRHLVLKQGDAPARDLVARFKEDGRAVLFGLRTFWQGVDVQGDALSLVTIDKLPFAVPDDPVFEARKLAVNLRHGSDYAWFPRLAVPAATIQVKQGYGRLIRTMTDRGVVALLDPRLVTKSYGRTVLAALPPTPTTHSMDVVRAFFARAGAF